MQGIPWPDKRPSAFLITFYRFKIVIVFSFYFFAEDNDCGLQLFRDRLYLGLAKGIRTMM
jgi:hypothetical protein